jgi:hypothetical protein
MSLIFDPVKENIFSSATRVTTLRDKAQIIAMIQKILLLKLHFLALPRTPIDNRCSKLLGKNYA